MWGLGVLIPLLGAGALRVIQEPGELRVTAGDTVALDCRVEVAESGAVLRLRWERDGDLGVLCATRLHLGTALPLVPCPRRVPEVQLAWQPPLATLRLPRVRDSDSGRYLCQVTLEIPRYGSATGNGTEMSVTPAAAVGGHPAALLWGLLGALGGAALLLGMALLGYRRCHRSSDTAIYLNVVSRRPQHPTKPPPLPELKHNPYQEERAQGPPVPPRP